MLLVVKPADVGRDREEILELESNKTENDSSHLHRKWQQMQINAFTPASLINWMNQTAVEDASNSGWQY